MILNNNLENSYLNIYVRLVLKKLTDDVWKIAQVPIWLASLVLHLFFKWANIDSL